MEEVEKNQHPKVNFERVLYTILYLFIVRIISMVLFVIVITQFIYSWLSDGPNEKFLHFAKGLSEYSKQLVSYVGLNSNEKPWPSGDWPDV